VFVRFAKPRIQFGKDSFRILIEALAKSVALEQLGSHIVARRQVGAFVTHQGLNSRNATVRPGLIVV